MKKLIFAIVVVLVSVIVLSACSEDSILTDLEENKNITGGGDDSDPIIED